MFGQSGFNVTQNVLPIGPPLPANTAENGVSVDPITGRIVLGNDIGGTGAELLSSREIEMQGFLFQMLNAALRQFIIDPGAQFYGIGDIDVGNNGLRLQLNDAASIVRLENAAELMMLIAAGNYSFGNISGAGNGSFTAIDDLNESFVFRSTANQRMLAIEGFNRMSRMGDIDSAFNDTVFSVDDINQIIKASTGLQDYLTIDPTGSLIQLGDAGGAFDGMALSFYGGGYCDLGDTNSLNNNTVLSVDDSIQQVAASVSGNTLLDLRMSTGIYRMGRVTGGNNTRLSIDDNTGIFDIRNGALTAAITMNNVAGFTGTVTPVNSITVDGGIVTAVT